MACSLEDVLDWFVSYYEVTAFIFACFQLLYLFDLVVCSSG